MSTPGSKPPRCGDVRLLGETPGGFSPWLRLVGRTNRQPGRIALGAAWGGAYSALALRLIAQHDGQLQVYGDLKRPRLDRMAKQRWREALRASLCSHAVAYARSFPYDDWRGNLIIIVSYGWKEWMDGNQDSG